ncbi:MAG: AtpZ/AtpI family protein [Chloroflexi bacterium]|nr:AtpZ/AtpI family protein [Chloroflexota bacterium]
MSAFRLVGMGWYVVVCIVLGVLGGVWLDKLVGIPPAFTLLGLFLGLITAFYGVYRMVVTTIRGDNTDGGDSK